MDNIKKLQGDYISVNEITLFKANDNVSVYFAVISQPHLGSILTNYCH